METPDHSAPLIEQIRDAVARGRVSLPPLPEFTGRLMALLNEDSEADAKEIAGLVQNEPAVAATLLKMANSAVFGGLKEITSLPQAVARLGLKQVSSAVATLTHVGNFQAGDDTRRSVLRREWDHAIAVAVAARRLGNLTGGDDQEAFLAGLLHDVGKLLVLKGVDYCDNRGGSENVTPDLLDELMQSLHTELGNTTLVAWRLPEPICRVALHHHDEPTDPGDSLLSCVQAANALAHKLEAAESSCGDLAEVEAVDRLDLSDIELATLTVDVEDEIEEVRRLF